MSNYFCLCTYNKNLHCFFYFFLRTLLDNYYTLLEESGQDFWWIHDVQKLVSNTHHSSEKLKKGLVCFFFHLF